MSSTAVDDYLARLPGEERQALGALRATIRSVVPNVEEVLRRGVPAFRMGGRPLVSMGAAKRHLALYVMYGSALVTHRDRLCGFDVSAKTLRFTPDRLPTADVIATLIRARLDELHGSA